MARRRDEDEEDDRPRRRRRHEDDDDDEDNEDGRRRGRRRGDDGPFDETFASTPLPLLIVFSVFCGCISFVMSLLVLITGKDPLARQNAQVCLIVSVAGVFVGVALRIALLVLQIW